MPPYLELLHLRYASKSVSLLKCLFIQDPRNDLAVNALFLGLAMFSFGLVLPLKANAPPP